MKALHLVIIIGCGAAAAMTSKATAHPMDPNVLQIQQTGKENFRVVWTTSTPSPQTVPLSQAPCVPSTRTDGEASLSGPRPTKYVNLDCGPSGLDGAAFILPVASTKTDTIVRVLQTGQAPWTTVVRAGEERLVLPKQGERTLWTLVPQYLALGVEHILLGIDHLAFVLGLFLLVRSRRTLLWTITAFTAGHSVTLALSTLDIVHPRSAPVEVMIAFSIVLLAREIGRPPTPKSRLAQQSALVAASFGLLHGFGFAGALRELGVPAEQAFVALASFNLGVEAGQLLFVLGLMAVRMAYRRLAPQFSPSPRWLGYALGVASTVWVIERAAHLGV